MARTLWHRPENHTGGKLRIIEQTVSFAGTCPEWSAAASRQHSRSRRMVEAKRDPLPTTSPCSDGVCRSIMLPCLQAIASLAGWMAVALQERWRRSMAEVNQRCDWKWAGNVGRSCCKSACARIQCCRNGILNWYSNVFLQRLTVELTVIIWIISNQSKYKKHVGCIKCVLPGVEPISRKWSLSWGRNSIISIRHPTLYQLYKKYV